MIFSRLASTLIPFPKEFFLTTEEKQAKEEAFWNSVRHAKPKQRRRVIHHEVAHALLNYVARAERPDMLRVTYKFGERNTTQIRTKIWQMQQVQGDWISATDLGAYLSEGRGKMLIGSDVENLMRLIRAAARDER